MNSTDTILNAVATEAVEAIAHTPHANASPAALCDALRFHVRELVIAAYTVARGGRMLPVIVRKATDALVTRRELPAFHPDRLSDDADADVRTFYAAIHHVHERIQTLGERLEYAEAPNVLATHDTTEPPRAPLADISARLYNALAEFERVSADVGTAAKAWGDEALTGPALKAECMADLITLGRSRNAAEKEVTGTEKYGAYRERLDELARKKHDAETAADVARVRVNVFLELSASARTAALTGEL
jgi:hypothetical protein